MQKTIVPNFALNFQVYLCHPEPSISFNLWPWINMNYNVVMPIQKVKLSLVQ